MIGKKGESTVATNSGTNVPGDVRAILGKGSEFEGKLRFEGTVRIDGKFKGEVISAGTLIVGENAVIDGDMDVDSAVISGKINGNVSAKTRVEMHAPARLVGNIKCPVLVIQEGVFFDGNCQMGKDGGGSRPAASTPTTSVMESAAKNTDD